MTHWLASRTPLQIDDRPRGAPAALSWEKERVALARGRSLTIGSAAGADVVLVDRFVSARHCVLEWRESDLVVRDLRSRNGTHVNGVRVAEAVLAVGDRLRVGETRMTVAGPQEDPRPIREQLVGADPAFRAAVDMAVRLARSSSTVLIRGESGTGKELFARLVHDESRRASGPFVPLNCGALSRTLVDSQLFGHERGAFTGASERHVGVFEQASGGTLFLDEIGELPPDQQSHLLRVLETARIRPVGAEREVEVDARIVAATHQDLGAQPWFRFDLYHRLAQVVLFVPALRERRDDIPLLVRTFVEAAAREYGPHAVDDWTLEQLAALPWPGNVRELRNAVNRAALLGDHQLRLEDFIGRAEPRRAPAPAPSPQEAPVRAAAEEERVVREALAEAGSFRRAAHLLGMPRSTFYERARRMGLKPGPREED